MGINIADSKVYHVLFTDGEDYSYVVVDIQAERKCECDSKEMTSNFRIVFHNATLVSLAENISTIIALEPPRERCEQSEPTAHCNSGSLL